MERWIDDPQPFSLPYKPRSVPIWSRFLQVLSLPFDAMKMIVIDSVRSNDKNSLKRNVLTGEKVTSMTDPIPLSLLKSVKVSSTPASCFSRLATSSTSSITINDVMMTSVFSALGQVSNSGERSARVVFPIYLASIPKGITLNNKYSLILLRLPLLEKNPADDALIADLAGIGTILSEAKHSNIPLLTSLLERAMMILPGLFSVTAIEKAVNRSTAVISNIIGPSTQISIFGHRVNGIMPFLPNKGNLSK